MRVANGSLQIMLTLINMVPIQAQISNVEYDQLTHLDINFRIKKMVSPRITRSNPGPHPDQDGQSTQNIAPIESTTIKALVSILRIVR